MRVRRLIISLALTIATLGGSAATAYACDDWIYTPSCGYCYYTHSDGFYCYYYCPGCSIEES